MPRAEGLEILNEGKSSSIIADSEILLLSSILDDSARTRHCNSSHHSHQPCFQRNNSASRVHFRIRESDWCTNYWGFCHFRFVWSRGRLERVSSEFCHLFPQNGELFSLCSINVHLRKFWFWVKALWAKPKTNSNALKEWKLPCNAKIKGTNPESVFPFLYKMKLVKIKKHTF